MPDSDTIGQTKITDMKKTIFILLAACFFQAAIAQKSRVGITGGVTTSNIYDNIEGNDKTDAKWGSTFGLILEAPLCGKFSFQPGAHYVQKGAIISETSEEKISIALRYAELHCNFLYNTKGKDGGIFAGLGPVLSFAMPSKRVTDNDEGTSEQALSFGNEPIDDLRGVDYGANGILGYRGKKGLLLAFNYTLGLRNINPGGGEPKIKSGSFGIRLGYLFNNK